MEIRRRDFLGMIGLGVGSVVFSPVIRAEEKKERPNILFFFVDDQRNDTLGCAGHPILKTPVVDSLAAEGVRFENAFVTTSICAASRATVFTGLYERTHGFTFGTPPIGAEHVAASYPTILTSLSAAACHRRRQRRCARFSLGQGVLTQPGGKISARLAAPSAAGASRRHLVRNAGYSSEGSLKTQSTTAERLFGLISR